MKKYYKIFINTFFLFFFCVVAAQKDTLSITVKETKEKDYYNVFQTALNRKDGKTLKIIVKKGKYLVSQNLTVSRPHTTMFFEEGAEIYFTTLKSGFSVIYDYFTIKNAKIFGNGQSAKDFYSGYGILLNGASFCKILNCSFAKISGNSIFLYPRSPNKGSSNNVIIGNKISNPAFDLGSNGDESAIMLGYSGENYHHNNNIISNNNIDCNYVLKIGAGIIGHGKNNVFDSNTITNCRNYGIISYESIDRDSTLIHTVIQNNVIKNIGEVTPNKTVKGMGIYTMKTQNVEVKFNKIFNTLLNSDQTETLGAGSISISGCPNSVVSNNYIEQSYMYGIVSDYSFGSTFKDNNITKTRKSGMYFINMNDVIVTGNRFSNIGEVVLKGYFENTSLPYIKAQMRTTKYQNIDTGNNFLITGNTFYTPNDILYFAGTPEDKSQAYKGNFIKNNKFQNNIIIGNNKPDRELVFFRQDKKNANIISNNSISTQ